MLHQIFDPVKTINIAGYKLIKKKCKKTSANYINYALISQQLRLNTSRCAACAGADVTFNKDSTLTTQLTYKPRHKYTGTHDLSYNRYYRFPANADSLFKNLPLKHHQKRERCLTHSESHRLFLSKDKDLERDGCSPERSYTTPSVLQTGKLSIA